MTLHVDADRLASWWSCDGPGCSASTTPRLPGDPFPLGWTQVGGEGGSHFCPEHVASALAELELEHDAEVEHVREQHELERRRFEHRRHGHECDEHEDSER